MKYYLPNARISIIITSSIQLIIANSVSNMTSDMFVDQLVSTPYGDGHVIQILDNKVVVQPLTWTMARNQRPTFYMNASDVQPLFSVGSQVQTVFGRGIIVDFRKVDRMYVVKLDNWKLADNKSPTLYLNQSSFTKLKTDALVRGEVEHG